MANSLVKLTLESNQYEKGMRQAQKSWNDFTKGIGLSMSKFTAVGAAIGAVTGALKVAKDAFFKNEQQLDEWGRTVEASKSLYNGFLNSINNGDISGFLSNINTITEAARSAYDALDNLSTFNAFNQIQTQKTRTGLTEAMAGYRMGEVSKEDVQKAAKAYQDELHQRQKLETFG
jgi:DNA-binding PucR family transcriptional regulator